MSTTVGRLSIGVGADTRGLASGMKRAQALTRRFGRVARRAALGVAAIAAAAGTAALAIGTKLVKDQLAAMDTMTKFADRIGVATGRLAGLEHAAALTGNSVQNLRLGLQRMTRRIAEAAEGSGVAAAALRELGLDAAQMAKLSPDEQFRRIAEAMGSVASRSDQVRLAFKLFDSEGVGLLNTLDLGARGLEEVQAEAEKLGIAFDRVDAAKVEAANDAIHRMKQVVVGVGRALTVGLAPYITALAERVTEAGLRGDGAAKMVVRGLELVATGVAHVVRVVDVVRGSIKIVQSAFNALVGQVVDGLGWYIEMAARAGEALRLDTSGLRSAARDLEHLAEGFRTSSREFSVEGGEFLSRDSVGEVRAFFRELREGADEAARAVAAGKGRVVEDAEAMAAAMAEHAEELEDLRRRAERITESVRTPAERFAADLRELESLLEKDLITRETYNRRLEELEEARDRALGRGRFAAADDPSAARDAIVGRLDRLVVGGAGSRDAVQVQGVRETLEFLRDWREQWRRDSAAVV